MQKTNAKAVKVIPENTKKNAQESAGTLTVYSMGGHKKEDIKSVFDGSPKSAVVAQAITMYLANRRTGLAATKTRGEVSGGGKKPWKQKGTGRARVGSSRNPLWRHGGVVFGPHQRNYHYALPAKIRNAALLSALLEKSANGDIMVVDALTIAHPKSKEIQALLDNLKINESVAIVMNTPDKNIQLASRNLPWVGIAFAKHINALDVLAVKKLVIVQDALTALETRLAGLVKK